MAKYPPRQYLRRGVAISQATTEPVNEELVGGQHGLALASKVVRYQPAVRATATRPARYEAIRMRLVYHRQVVQGRYLTVQGHREPGSVAPRTLVEHWDATVCQDAIRYARRRISQRLRPGRRRGLKTHAVVVVAEALHLHGAPVNHHLAAEVLNLFGLSCSRVWFNRTLRAAGWVPDDIRGYEVESHDPKGDQALGEGGTVEAAGGGGYAPLLSSPVRRDRAPGYGLTNWVPRDRLGGP